MLVPIGDFDTPEVDTGPVPDDEVAVQLTRAFAALKEDQSRAGMILEMRVDQGLANAEIAERLGVTEGEVRRVIRRLQRAIRARLPNHPAVKTLQHAGPELSA